MQLYRDMRTHLLPSQQVTAGATFPQLLQLLAVLHFVKQGQSEAANATCIQTRSVIRLPGVRVCVCVCACVRACVQHVHVHACVCGGSANEPDTCHYTSFPKAQHVIVISVCLSGVCVCVRVRVLAIEVHSSSDSDVSFLSGQFGVTWDFILKITAAGTNKPQSAHSTTNL